MKWGEDKNPIGSFFPYGDILNALIREGSCGGLEVYCRICGVALKENAYFCSACGARVRPQEKTVIEEFQVAGKELVRKVEELIHEGNLSLIHISEPTRPY